MIIRFAFRSTCLITSRRRGNIDFLPALLHYVDIIAAGLEDVHDRAELLAGLGNDFHADELEPVVRAFRERDRFFFRGP